MINKLSFSAILILAYTSIANAQEIKNKDLTFNTPGTYVLIAPSFEFSPFSGFGYKLSVGGYVPSKNPKFGFAGMYGFSFKHSISSFANSDFGYEKVQMFRPGGEFRLGIRNKNVFGYGLIGVGLSFIATKRKEDEFNFSDDSSKDLGMGAHMPIGLGILGLPGKLHEDDKVKFMFGFESRTILFGEGFKSVDLNIILGIKF